MLPSIEGPYILETLPGLDPPTPAIPLTLERLRLHKKVGSSQVSRLAGLDSWRMEALQVSSCAVRIKLWESLVFG